MPDPVDKAIQDMFRVAPVDPSKMRAVEMAPAPTPEPTIQQRVEERLKPFQQGGVTPAPAVRQGAINEAIARSPEVRAGLAGAALTAPFALAPAALGVAAPAIPEFLSMMGLGGLTSAAGEAVRQHGDVLGKYKEPVAMGVEMLAPLGAEAAAARIAPRAAAETKMMAREAEKEGFKVSPHQVTLNPAANFSEHNNVVANRMVTGVTGYESDKLDPKYFRNRNGYFSKEYGDIYSANNQFNISPEDRAAIDTAWTDLKATARVPPSSVKAIETKAAALFGGTGPVTGKEVKAFTDELGKLGGMMDNPLTYDVGKAATDLRALTRKAFTADNPALQSRLKRVNQQYGSYVVLDEMNRANKIPNMNVDLQELDKRLRMGSKKYREGLRDDPTAKAARIGERLNMRPTPPAEKRDTLGRTIGAGTGAAAGYGLSTMMGGGPFESGAAALAGAKGADVIGKLIGSPLDAILNPVGRLLQRMPRPQAEDLARRGLVASMLGRARVPAAATAAGEMTGQDDERQ